MLPQDAILVLRVQQEDDRHAFEHLVRRYQSQLRSLLRRLTGGDQALADDLAQESFLRAYRRLHRLENPNRFRPWLYRIAYRRFLDHHQKHQRRQSLQDTHANALESPNDNSDGSLRLGFQHDLERAIQDLSHDEQAVLTLTYGGDATHADVAQVLDCPLGTVKTHLLRAKAKLRKKLQGWEGKETL